MNRITILILIVLFAKVGLSQESWSLQKCIDHALQNSIEVQQQSLSESYVSKNYNLARAGRLPSVNGYYNHNMNNGKALNSDSYSYVNQKFYDGNMGVYSRMDIFKGMYHHNNIKKSQDLAQSAAYTTQKVKNDLSIAIVEVYLQILYNKELLEVSESQLLIVEEQIGVAQKLVEAGVKTKDELLKLQYQLASEKVGQTQVKNDLKNNKLSMVLLLGLPHNEIGTFDIESPENLMVSPVAVLSPDSLYAVSVGLLPEFKAQEFLIKSYEKDLKLAQSGMYPSLHLAYQYYTRYNELGVNHANPAASYSIGDQLSDNAYGRVTFGLEIPIFNKLSVKTNKALAEIQRQDAEFDLQNLKKNHYQDIHIAHNDMQATFEKFKMQEEALKYAKESFRFAQQQLEAGVISTLQFNIEKNTLIKAESELIQAKYQYVFSLKLLDFYMGNSIVG